MGSVVPLVGLIASGFSDCRALGWAHLGTLAITILIITIIITIVLIVIAATAFKVDTLAITAQAFVVLAYVKKNDPS